MSYEEIASEGETDLVRQTSLGAQTSLGNKTESMASCGNGKKWKLKNQRLSSTIDSLAGLPTASTIYMSGRTRLASNLEETFGAEDNINAPSGLTKETMHNFSDIIGELPFEAPFYEKPKLKNRRIPPVLTKDGVPVWMLDQGAKNVPDTKEASAIMDVLDEACNLFLCIPQLQALEVQHTAEEPSARAWNNNSPVSSWNTKRRGNRMPDMYHNKALPLTAEVLAQFDAWNPDYQYQDVEVPCCEVVTKSKLKNRSLWVPAY